MPATNPSAKLLAWHADPANKAKHKAACQAWRPDTMARDAQFEALYREGKTIREIAAHFERLTGRCVTFQRVQQILKARGVKMRAMHNGAEVSQ